MERLAIRCTNNIGKYNNKTELELRKIKYGVEVMFINISKFLIIISVAYLFKAMYHTLIMMSSFGLIRSNAFGLHFKNSIVCTVISTLLFMSGVFIGRYYPMEVRFLIPIFLLLIALFMKYAPSDTEARPIIGKNLRKRLRRNTAVITLILFMISVIVTNKTVSTLITLGAVMECVFILPITYKILGRRYNNYEQYR